MSAMKRRMDVYESLEFPNLEQKFPEQAKRVEKENERVNFVVNLI